MQLVIVVQHMQERGRQKKPLVSLSRDHIANKSYKNMHRHCLRRVLFCMNPVTLVIQKLLENMFESYICMKQTAFELADHFVIMSGANTVSVVACMSRVISTESSVKRRLPLGGSLRSFFSKQTKDRAVAHD